MKRVIWSLGLSVLCVIGAMGIVGCEDDDSDAPSSISGTWSGTFRSGGDVLANESWVFTQDGDAVTGAYTFDGVTYTFTGTYDDGDFSGVDDDGWTIRLNFEDDTADGTISGAGEIWNVSLIRQ